MSSSRPRSFRLRERNSLIRAAKATEAYPGLNDITDAFEAFPSEIVKYFTLYKEIDAKYIAQIPLLHHKIDQFKKQPKTEDNLSKRVKLIKEVSELLTKMLPCMEEKMHVASIAADRSIKYVDRINDDFELILKGEIPDSVRLGQINHPAIINDTKIPEIKSAQTQRSESRREALAAKKAANETDGDDTGNTTNTATTSNRAKNRRDKDSNANPKKRKATSNNATTSHSTSTTTSNSNSGNSVINNSNRNNNGANNTQNTSNAHPLVAPVPTTVRSTSSLSQSTTPANVHDALSSRQAQGSSLKEEVNSRPSTPASKRQRTASKKKQEEEEEFYIGEDGQKRNSQGEPVYCYCNQVSYGEMVGCDGEDCKREWFHLPCTGLATLPRGKWYCDECKAKKNRK